MRNPYYRLSYTYGASASYYYGGLARSLRIIDTSSLLLIVDRRKVQFLRWEWALGRYPP